MGATDSLGLDLSPEARRRGPQATDGHGVDTVIEASGAPDAVVRGPRPGARRGRVVICGHYTDNGDVRIHPHYHINRKHVEIRGCWRDDFSHVHRAVAIAANTRRPLLARHGRRRTRSIRRRWRWPPWRSARSESDRRPH
ncbi:MAG: hypothetical protein IPF98_25245 [Gemmatimonadetes bacterium]|nr:hypothetical protein [Gemmatimonadota bacterium]